MQFPRRGREATRIPCQSRAIAAIVRVDDMTPTLSGVRQICLSCALRGKKEVVMNGNGPRQTSVATLDEDTFPYHGYVRGAGKPRYRYIVKIIDDRLPNGYRTEEYFGYSHSVDELTFTVIVDEPVIKEVFNWHWILGYHRELIHYSQPVGFAG